MPGPVSKLDLELVRQQIAAKLCDLERLFAPEMRLTFVARHPTEADRFIVVTSDDSLAGVAAAVMRSGQG